MHLLLTAADDLLPIHAFTEGPLYGSSDTANGSEPWLKKAKTVDKIAVNVLIRPLNSAQKLFSPIHKSNKHLIFHCP